MEPLKPETGLVPRATDPPDELHTPPGSLGTTIGRRSPWQPSASIPASNAKIWRAGAVSELQGIARFKTPSAHLLSMSDLASRGSIALR